MRSAPLRAMGELLDRAVHVVVRRALSLALPFVVVDAIAGYGSSLLGRSLWSTVASILLIGVAENRARVIGVRAARAPKGAGVPWRAALGHPGALVFVLFGVVDVLPEFVIFGIAAVIAATTGVLAHPPESGEAAPYIMVIAIVAFVLGVVGGAALLAVVLLIPFVATVALIANVDAGAPPWRALGSWIREAFRLRAIGTTLMAALAFNLLVQGVPFVLALASYGPEPVRAAVYAFPEGVADAIALMFAWNWRDAVLNGRYGRDLDELLNATPEVPPPASI